MVTKGVNDLPDRGFTGKLDKKEEKRVVGIFSRNSALMQCQGQAKLKSRVLNITNATI